MIPSTEQSQQLAWLHSRNMVSTPTIHGDLAPRNERSSTEDDRLRESLRWLVRVDPAVGCAQHGEPL